MDRLQRLSYILENYQALKTMSFKNESALLYMKILCHEMKRRGYDLYNKDEFGRGILDINGVEIINSNNLPKERSFIFSNHTSDMDALIIKAIFPNSTIIAKEDWTKDERLMYSPLGNFLDLIGLDRGDRKSRIEVLKETIELLQNDPSADIAIFLQGTISNILKNSKERISDGFLKLANKKKILVTNVFIEQPQSHLLHKNPTCRVVIDEPTILPDGQDYREIFIEREKSMAYSLKPNVRKSFYTKEHRYNNNRNEKYFKDPNRS